MKREPSKYQKDILDWVKNGSGNCVVDALAGTGKSTTLEMIAQNLPEKSRMLFLAFNKHIKDELLQKEGLQEILNSNRLKIMTVNSLGNSTVLEYGKGKDGKSTVELCPNKLTKLILDDVIYECMLRENKAPQNYDTIAIGLIKRHAKTCIDLVRSKLLDYKKVTEIDKLIEIEHLFMFPKNILIDFKIPHLDWSWIVSEAIEREIEMFQETGEYDFIDQVYLPVVLNLPLPQWVRWYTDFVCVDECIPYDYYVKTDKGLVRMDSLYNKVDKGEHIFVKTFNEIIGDFEQKPVINVVKKGTKPVFKIKTEGLKVIEATSNHLFLTQRGWVKLEDLQEGKDFLICDSPENQKTKYLLNDDQFQVALASSIGDGNLQKQGVFNTYRLKFTQQEKQRGYLHFKMKMFDCKNENVGKSGYTGKKNIWNSSTKTFIYDGEFKKNLSKMDARGFAIWYMDDGSICGNSLRNIRIACNNLTSEEADILESRLKDFSINVKRYLAKGKYQEFHFNTENGTKFLKLIAPYMNKDCFYKNPFSTGNYNWDFSGYKKFGGDFIKSITYSRECPVYDIEVKDNHNFIITRGHTNKNGAGVIVHNCQDLSVLQQRFISKLQYINSYNTTRYIFVGDKRQAIYKFNGADSTSIENIEKYFHTKEFPLNICYRCPVKALDLAREYVPQIENRQNAIEGAVTTINDSEVADLAQAGDLIMARKNKDLIKVFLQILKKRKKVYFKKADFLNTILNNIKSRKKIKTMKDLRDFINKEKEKQNELKQEEDSQKSVLDVEDEDVFSTMLSLVQFFEQNAKEMEYPLTIQGFFTFISDIISNEPSKDCITVGSIHSMKGLEANRVFIVNYFEMPYNFGMGEDYFTQEKNLKYIAETRTKNELFLCVNDMDED